MIVGKTAGWQDVEFGFTVPAADCPAQYLRLDLDARMSSELFVSGRVWFGALQLVRLADVASK